MRLDLLAFPIVIFALAFTYAVGAPSPATANAGIDVGRIPLELRKKPPKTTTKKTSGKKKKLRWNEIVAQSVKDNAVKNELSFYFWDKSRMRRLINRLYQEEVERRKAKIKHSKFSTIYNTLAKHKYKTKAGRRNRNKIIAAFTYYEDLKKKRLTKSQYRKLIHELFGFFP